MKLRVVFLILTLVILACGKGSGSSETFQFWTPTSNATQTAIVKEITSTPSNTQTPEIVVVVHTNTPSSTTRCVTATEAVYLRPTAGTNNYPILPLPKGAKVTLSLAENGNWLFVSYDHDGEIKSGWVNKSWLGECS